MKPTSAIAPVRRPRVVYLDDALTIFAEFTARLLGADVRAALEKASLDLAGVSFDEDPNDEEDVDGRAT